MEKSFLTKILSIFSRTSYTISPESFKEQLSDVTSDSLKSISIRNPMSSFDSPATRIRYEANQIKKITAVDKNTQRVMLDNSPALEVRITLDNGKRHIFYFDTLFIEQGFLIGEKSRLMHLRGKVPIAGITKVEIQNGGKRYKYDR